MFSTALRSFRLFSTREIISKCRQFSITTPSPSAGLSLQYRDDVAVIKMDNGENRLNSTFVGEFLELLDAVEGDPKCRALVTVGEGKFYSLGFDLQSLKSESDAAILKFLRDVNYLQFRLKFSPLPTLAAVNGHAFAGGCIMAAAHGLRVMNSEKGWICLNEVIIGVPFNKFLLSVVTNGFSSGQTLSDMVLLGKRYTGPEAIEKGIVHAVAPSASLLDDSIKFLNTQVDKKGIPRDALKYMKLSLFKDVVAEYEVVNRPDFESSDIAQSMMAAIKVPR